MIINFGIIQHQLILFMRIYSKELKLNRNIIRWEIEESPDILFKNLLVEFIRNDNHQRLLEVLV